jgi:hypothetical protein
MDYFRPPKSVLGETSPVSDLDELLSRLATHGSYSVSHTASGVPILVDTLNAYFSAYLERCAHQGLPSILLIWIPDKLFSSSPLGALSRRNRNCRVVRFDSDLQAIRSRTGVDKLAVSIPSRFGDESASCVNRDGPSALAVSAAVEVVISPSDEANDWRDGKTPRSVIFWNARSFRCEIRIHDLDRTAQNESSLAAPLLLRLAGAFGGTSESGRGVRLDTRLVAHEAGRTLADPEFFYRIRHYTREHDSYMVSEAKGSVGARPGGKSGHSPRSIFLVKGVQAWADFGLLMQSSDCVFQDVFCQYDQVRIDEARRSGSLPRKTISLTGYWLVLGTTNNVISHFIFESLKRTLYAANFVKFSVLVPPGTATHILEFLDLLIIQKLILRYEVGLRGTSYSADAFVYVCEDVRDFTCVDAMNFAMLGARLPPAGGRSPTKALCVAVRFGHVASFDKRGGC